MFHEVRTSICLVVADLEQRFSMKVEGPDFKPKEWLTCTAPQPLLRKHVVHIALKSYERVSIKRK